MSWQPIAAAGITLLPGRLLHRAVFGS